jgi:organic radical activating enzyme
MEQFYSVQGEGFFSGRPAVFIRLGGCDVGCVWCDVKESWEAANHPNTELIKIVADVLETSCRFVVITGGEPAMYDLTDLTVALKKEGIEIAIETSGVYPLHGSFDWVCFSPKKFKSPHPSIYAVANELKVIVFHPSDINWAEGHAAKVNSACKLYLQPEWSKREQMTPLIFDYIREQPKWNLSLQTHKYIDVP